MALNGAFDSTRQPFGLGKPLRVRIINRSTEEAKTDQHSMHCSSSKERYNRRITGHSPQCGELVRVDQAENSAVC